MSQITPSRETGRPKGYVANSQPQTKTMALLGAVARERQLITNALPAPRSEP
ncbi:hypothetical protein X739_05940 [Mesorhizobium sp. LNHC220B00]|nr:hypothetical protein [Mesorhizobium sp. LNHC220B00]ESY88045.1 hypothetical protein X739_05940 [Mesorhizobium sp. LNHC220B00]